MLILGIETSCDETAAALVEDGIRVVSECLASQEKLHGPYGGVIPELACRRHVSLIDGVVRGVLRQADVGLEAISAVSVTRGPGLIGALLTGVGFAKGLAYSAGRPLIGVNHLEGHLYAVQLSEGRPIEYPAVALVVSGGHTHLFYLSGPDRYRLIGRTLDDAAGEALDKAAKLLGLGYPGGPAIDRLSRQADPAWVAFPRPNLESRDLNFSFSGLKTALLRYLDRHPGAVEGHLADIAASYQQAVIEVLVEKTAQAARICRVERVLVGGGVAANSLLRGLLQEVSARQGFEVRIPVPRYCTDNAAMIASAAHPRFLEGQTDDWTMEVAANLPLHEARPAV